MTGINTLQKIYFNSKSFIAICQLHAFLISNLKFNMAIPPFLIPNSPNPSFFPLNRGTRTDYTLTGGKSRRKKQGVNMILRGDFSSKALRSRTNIQILIPTKGDAPYRIVYLFHGLHGNQGTWLDYTMLPYYAEKYNAVFVMPEVGRSFYANMKYGRKYFDYISEELPAMCGKIFNISAETKDTAAMGCSMGGFGALRLALVRHDIFGFCGAIAPAGTNPKHFLKVLREEPDSYRKKGPEEEETYTDIRSIYGDALEYNPEYDIFHLIEKFPAGKPKPVIYTTCGAGDNLRSESLKLNEAMKNTDFDFTYEEWEGGHDWYFFNDALKKTLDFWNER